MIAYPKQNEKTRSNITSTVTGTIDLLNRGILREHFSKGTNVTPANIAGGKILLHSMSVKEFGETGALAQVIWKYAFQRDIERSDVKANPRPVFLHVDEFQLFTTSYDSSFASTCRSSRVSFVILTQSLPTIYAAHGGGEKAKFEVQSLCGNLNLKIFCANGEVTTNQWASEMIGKRRQFFINASNSSQREGIAMTLGGSPMQTSSGVSEQMDFDVPSSHFSKLRVWVRNNKYFVDAIIFKNGASFRATGRNWMKTTFRQKF